MQRTIPTNMGWIQEHLHSTSGRERIDAVTGDDFVAAARARWQRLADDLKADVAEFDQHQSGADFSAESSDHYRVRNSVSGLELDIEANFEDRTVRYDYKAINQNSVGAPEGGMLSMRRTRSGGVEFYSADERLTSEEVRQVLLSPVLFPPQVAA